jgi:hypothetical protein
VGTRTSGSEGGGEQTTARKRGTAARLRPYLEIVRRTQRNVKRWASGEMALRWTAAGMLEAERQFRKIIGYRDLATLVVAIEREHEPSPSRRCRSHLDQGGRYRPHRLTITLGPPPKIHGARDILWRNHERAVRFQCRRSPRSLRCCDRGDRRRKLIEIRVWGDHPQSVIPLIRAF